MKQDGLSTPIRRSQNEITSAQERSRTEKRALVQLAVKGKVKVARTYFFMLTPHATRQSGGFRLDQSQDSLAVLDLIRPKTVWNFKLY